jgi:hypothetical protein
MLIQDTTNTGTYEVTAVTDANNLVIKHLYGADLFASGDAYTINETIQAYATSDDIYDLIIDAVSDGTSYSNTLIKTPAANFGTVVQVRRGKSILPFEQNQTVSDTNVSVTAVRTPDTVAQ